MEEEYRQTDCTTPETETLSPSVSGCTSTLEGCYNVICPVAEISLGNRCAEFQLQSIIVIDPLRPWVTPLIPLQRVHLSVYVYLSYRFEWILIFGEMVGKQTPTYHIRSTWQRKMFCNGDGGIFVIKSLQQQYTRHPCGDKWMSFQNFERGAQVNYDKLSSMSEHVRPRGRAMKGHLCCHLLKVLSLERQDCEAR